MKRMKVTYIIVLMLSLLTVSTPCRAGYGRINYDPVVNPFLVATFAANKEIEKRNLETLTEIRKAYTGAALAVSGIYEAKRMERKWRRDPLGLAVSSMENYYYQEIYDMVQNRIIPRIYRTALLCVYFPDQADVWLPSLFKVCTEVESLCIEFSSVVTNGSLTFSGISFPQIADELLDMFGITELKGVDWETMIDGIVNFELPDMPDISTEDIKEDFKNIWDFGSDVATDTWDAVGDAWDDRDKVKDGWESVDAVGKGKGRTIKYFKKKFKQIKNSVDSLKNIYATYHDQLDVRGKLEGFMGVLDSTNVMQKLFQYREITAEDVTNDVKVNNDSAQFYRQKVCIVKHYKQPSEWKSEVIAEYRPEYDDNWSWNRTNGSERFYDCWVRTEPTITSKFDINGWPYDESSTYSEWVAYRDAAKTLSQSKSGFDFNLVGDDNTRYKYNYNLVHHEKTFSTSSLISISGTSVLLAYSIQVMKIFRERDDKEEVLQCEWFDSKSTDHEAFAEYMNSLLAQYQTEKFEVKEHYESDDELANSEYTYELVWGDKVYYREADIKKMEGCYSVEFTADCHDGGNLGENRSSWKVNEDHEGKYVTEYSKQLAMEDIETYDKSTKCLDDLLEAIRIREDSVAVIQKEVDELNIQLEELAKQMVLTLSKEVREQYESVKGQRDVKNGEIQRIKNDISVLKSKESDARDDAKDEGMSVRIPWHMRYYSTMFPSLEWTDDGHWEGETFVRKAKIAEYGGDITFTAKLIAKRDESWALGIIRYHRSILTIESSLDYASDTHETVGFLEFSESMSAADKKAKVDAQVHELMEDFEGCSISFTESYNKPIEEEDGDVIHLLWPSDRLRVARKVFNRLNRIHSELVLMEMYLHNSKETRLSLERIYSDGINMVYSVPTRGSLYLNNILMRWHSIAREASYIR